MDQGNLLQVEFNNKEKLCEKMKQWINRLRGELIEHEELKTDIEFVNEVLQQAETLITNHTYSSAVDRAHTAVHGYLKALCAKQNITFPNSNVKIHDMWGALKTKHPSFNINIKEGHKPINQTANAIGRFLENMNEIRNEQSFSHPNEYIIGK
ncbi:HEPN domain-containing protein [Lysinibacillus fusiformis]|uniref:HEPN domain-containing protein n=1 Tax=Lysinibacillus fusiformis TaxID=28031 RepID=UPI003CFF460A